jgi:phosphoenolpyruvate carboxykinase (ATP)
LINTGWTGGISEAGKRISLADTRRMVRAALTGQLNGVAYVKDPVFGLNFFQHCPGVPDEIPDPHKSWTDESAYESAARKLAGLFVANFEKYDKEVQPEVAAATPKCH